jgi:hypothetical protein
MTAEDIVDDRAGLRDHPPVVAVGDHRGLAERMNGFQFRRRKSGLRVALISFDFIGNVQFLQQPQDTLGPRVIEMMDDDHGRLLM